LRFAAVVFVQRIDKRRRSGGTVALQYERDALVQRGAQHGQRLFGRALAIEALQHQLTPDATYRDTTAAVDALGCPQQIAKHRFTCVGEGTRQTFDQGQGDRLCWAERLGVCGRPGQADRQRQHGASGKFSHGIQSS
jgi:hypothetical protein